MDWLIPINILSSPNCQKFCTKGTQKRARDEKRLAIQPLPVERQILIQHRERQVSDAIHRREERLPEDCTCKSCSPRME